MTELPFNFSINRALPYSFPLLFSYTAREKGGDYMWNHHPKYECCCTCKCHSCNKCHEEKHCHSCKNFFVNQQPHRFESVGGDYYEIKVYGKDTVETKRIPTEAFFDDEHSHHHSHCHHKHHHGCCEKKCKVYIVCEPKQHCGCHHKSPCHHRLY